MKESEKFAHKGKNFVMEKHSDEILEKHEQINRREDKEKEHTLQENARERARHPGDMKSATPYEWEDLEDYENELERLEREGPGT